MNPLRLYRIYRQANRLATLLEQASQSYERTHDVSKSLFASKVFWFNVFTAAAELTHVLPLPPGTVAIAAAIINIGLRAVTDQPVHVLPRS